MGSGVSRDSGRLAEVNAGSANRGEPFSAREKDAARGDFWCNWWNAGRGRGTCDRKAENDGTAMDARDDFFEIPSARTWAWVGLIVLVLVLVPVSFEKAEVVVVAFATAGDAGCAGTLAGVLL